MSCRHDIYQPASHQSLSAKELCFSRRHTTKHCNAHTFLVDQVASHEPHSVGKRALSLDKRALYPRGTSVIVCVVVCVAVCAVRVSAKGRYILAKSPLSQQKNLISFGRTLYLSASELCFSAKESFALGERGLSLDKRGPLFCQSLSLSNRDSRARVVTVRCNVCCSVCFSKETLTKRKFDAVCCSV